MLSMTTTSLVKGSTSSVFWRVISPVRKSPAFCRMPPPFWTATVGLSSAVTPLTSARVS